MKKQLCAAGLAAWMTLSGAGALAASTPSGWATTDIATAVADHLVPDALQSDWQRAITRAEFCTLGTQLLTAQGYTFAALTGDSPFTDTADEAVRRMQVLGVVTGVTDTTFAPDAPITRQEAATMLYRMTNSVALPTSYADQRASYAFADDESIADWAKEAVTFCYRGGVMSGVGQNRFDPASNYTVEQAVLTMLRLRSYAAAQAPTPIAMTAEGVPMLYSNNPEGFVTRKFERGGLYTAQTALPANQPTDIEFYHWNYMGSYQPMKIGVVVTNNGRLAADVSIARKGIGVGLDSIDVSAKCYLDFYADQQPETVTVDKGESKLVASTTVPGGSLINARYQLSTAVEGLSMKIVALKQDMTSEYLAKLPRGTDDGAGRTAGLFQYSERRASIDASNVRNFMLCGNRPSHWKLNPGEYPQSYTDVLAAKDLGTANFSYFLNGNFATTYNLTFTNTGGKTLYIRPNDPIVKDGVGKYVLYTPKQGWQVIQASVAQPYAIALDDAPSVRFLMLGGNYGNIGFHIA
ncbi:MAG: S-layer homology domain-containing protein [Clostridia bacterium]|nr:S-layer homology domain-containing protein [Clostridia bacterium]